MDASPDATLPAVVDAAPPADAGLQAPEPHVEFEPPYKLYDPPRPKGRIYAEAQDELLARWNLGGNGDPSFISNHPHFHPGARVIVRVEIPPGTLPVHAPYDRRTGRYRRVLSQTAVLAQARRRGYWPFRMCFEDGLRRDQRVHGKVSFTVRVAKSGHVARAAIVGEHLPDDAVRACLLERVRELVFTPGPTRSLGFALSVELWPGDAPVPLHDAPPDTTLDNPGVLDVAGIERVLEPARADVVACYKEGLARDPRLWGRLQLRIDLDEVGRIVRVRETESHFLDRDVSACVVRVVRALRFPAARDGALQFVAAIRFGEMPPLPSTNSGNQDGS